MRSRLSEAFGEVCQVFEVVHRGALVGGLWRASY
jgi:hypothetical protein